MVLINICITAFIAMLYATLWYMGENVPAWHVLVWVILVLVNELSVYLKSKSE
jgi:hypothetical protein